MVGQTNGRTDRQTNSTGLSNRTIFDDALTHLLQTFSNAIRQIFVHYLTVVPWRQLSLLLPGFVEGD